MFERIARATLTLAGLLSLVAATAGAQGRYPRGGYNAGPDYWVGLSYGLLDGATISDRTTGDTWQFGYTSQIRATLEKSMSNGVSLGIGAGFATAPLTFLAGTAPVVDASCLGQCQAHADITQYVAFLRGGTGLGFHGIYNLEGGVTQFSHFRDEANDAPLPPTNSGYDVTFGFGGGFGYGVSVSTEVYVVDSYDMVLHHQDTNSSSAPRMNNVRVGGRIGF